MPTPTINDFTVWVPARDLETSKRFYAALGFELKEAWGGNIDCSLGAAKFRLQDYYVTDWANNFMLQFWVDDPDWWYCHANSVIAAGPFEARTKAPEMIGDTHLCHVVDPSGVLLIFIK